MTVSAPTYCFSPKLSPALSESESRRQHIRLSCLCVVVFVSCCSSTQSRQDSYHSFQQEAERVRALPAWITTCLLLNPLFPVWFWFKTDSTTTHLHHSDLAASPLARLCGEQKIIGGIKNTVRPVKREGKLNDTMASPCACAALVPPVQNLLYLTKQIKIRTSYLCLTALHIPEGDHLSESIQQQQR